MTQTQDTPKTLDEEIDALYEASEPGRDRLTVARMRARFDALTKLKEIRQAATALARDLDSLVEHIDEQGLDAPIHDTGNLARVIDLGVAELAGIKTRIETLESLESQN